MSGSSSYYDIQNHQKDPRDSSLKSKSTSNLDHADQIPIDNHRQAQSTNTLPKAAQGPPGQPHIPQHMNRPGPQPRHDMRNYENYPQQGPRVDDRYSSQPNYVNQAELRGPYGQPLGDVRGAASTPNVREEAYRPDMSRSKSEEMDHSRVHEWQERNEIEQGRYGSRPQPAGYGGQDGQDVMRPREEDVPRSQANNQQYQQHFYSNTTPRTREATPPFEQLRRPPEMEDMRGKPGMAPKPSVAPKPPVKPQEVPRVQVDNRQTQPNFFEPHRQGAPGGAAHASPAQAGPYTSQPSYMSPNTPTSRGHQTVNTSNTDTRPPYARMEYTRDNKQSPPGRLEQYDKRKESPDLPPPPPDVPPPDLPPPPPEEKKLYGDEQMPPPPPPPNEYERQIQEEQEKMMRRMAGFDARSPQQAQPQRMPQDQYDRRDPYQGAYPGGQNRMPGQYADRYGPPSGQSQPQQPEPQRGPGSQPPMSQTGHRDYQNLPPMQNRPHDQRQGSSPAGRPQYPYRPPQDQQQQPLRAETNNAVSKPPPIAAKPRYIAPKPAFNKSSSPSPSPWEREEKERDSKRREEEVRRIRDMEIAELEAKPYLSPEEQERLSRLRLDQEFQRRVDEVKTKDDDDDDRGDSDNEITDRAAVSTSITIIHANRLYKAHLQPITTSSQEQSEISASMLYLYCLVLN